MRWGAGLAAAAVVALGGYVATQDRPLDRTCPVGVLTMQPARVHLGPTVVEHQNWVTLPRQLADDEVVYACADGLAIGRMYPDRFDVDPALGLPEVKVPTRWVDLTWAAGRLDPYQDVGRWTLVVLSKANDPWPDSAVASSR